MADSPTKFGKVTIQELKGVNEREQHANSDIGAFDILKGALPINKNTLTKPSGCKLLLEFGEPILSICQTNDSRRNIIIQTTNAIRIITEEELFNIDPDEHTLTPTATEDSNLEENMPQAIFGHKEAPGVNAPVIATSNFWQQAPLNEISSQLNPDGSAASFATLASNQITLQAGVYRISGWSVMSTNAGGTMAARLYNVTAAQQLFIGKANEYSCATVGADSALNHQLALGGDIVLAVPTIIEIQGKTVGTGSPHTFGRAKHVPGTFTLNAECYRFLRILKTA